MAAIPSRSSSIAFPISSAVHKLKSSQVLNVPHLFSYILAFLSFREILQATVNRSTRTNTPDFMLAQLRAIMSISLKELRIYQRLLKMEDLSSVLHYCRRVVHLDCSFEEMNDIFLLSLNRYLPNLRSINFMGCRHITSKGYISFFERNPQLHSIHLYYIEEKDVVLEKLVNFCPDLISISIGYCYKIDHLHILARCRKLTSLHISHHFFNAPIHQNVFANLQNLTHVTLPSYCNTDSYLRILTERSSKLISVTLVDQHFTEVTLCAFIKNCEDLQRLDVQSCPQLTDLVIQVLIAQKLRNLQMVNLSRCSRITERGILALRKKYPNANIISIKSIDTNPKAYEKASEKISKRKNFCRLC